MTSPAGGTPRLDLFQIGLTGGIATGKSTAAEVFRAEGAFVLDADQIGHQMMEPGTEAFEEIVAAFSPAVVGADGRIDRRALGTRVFSVPAERLRLNAILHPRIVAETDRRLIERARQAPGGMAVVQAALMVEAATHRRFDRLVVTHCPPEVQVARLREREGMSEAEAWRRIRAQAPPEAKLAVADYVIDTSGTLLQSRDRVREVFQALRREWAELRGLREGGGRHGLSGT